jgi:hypothetical protein|tara:strand:+ start:93 stop:266 length:174 start_codon:yes stop_codon:yes gene_type:complete
MAKKYFRDGKPYTGKFHKMPNGEIHTGASHTASSKRVYHYGGLSKTAQAKARKSRGK